MMDGKIEWGDFSEWLERIDESADSGCSSITCSDFAKLDDDISLRGLIDSFKRWIKKVDEAPTTTWKEELSVRGYDFVYRLDENDAEVRLRLEILLEALAGMQVFVSNTDHLSDRELYTVLLNKHLVQAVAQIPFDNHTGCVIDIIGSEVQEDPLNWLRYYASNRERMEWAKQNVGKRLPALEQPPYSRESRLPKP